MSHQSSVTKAPPLAPNRLGNLRFDAIAGFLVFLIAMPLCLAIARASGYPPIAGIWTAVIGGVITSLLSNSELTIKGPAAGLIVIVAGAVTDLGSEFATPGASDADKAFLGYKLALGIGVAAGVIQILFGLIRAGRLADLFPLTPVHGMLASIGLIIISKQAYEVIGVPAPKHPDGSSFGPLELFAGLPSAIQKLNPEVAIIGLASLAILFGLPLIARRVSVLKKVPGQLIVLIVAVVLGSTMVFDLGHEHTYLFPDHLVDGHLENGEYTIGPKFLVAIPKVIESPADAFALPDFRALATASGLQYLVLFTLIGSLESLLSAKAVELLDPWKRKTNFDRDLFAVGLANTASSMVGGLPMISEIVRSKANIDSGARTRYANLYHGLFLLGFVLVFPNMIQQIPLAALGAMLVFTGFRLASPREFSRVYRVGSDQFLVFMTTVIATLATDLLIGIGSGIGLKVLIHLVRGVPISCFFKAPVEIVPQGDNACVILVQKAAVFSNWLGLRKAILSQFNEREAIYVDLSNTRFVDHSVMEKLHELTHDFAHAGKALSVIGLENHVPVSRHPLCARRSSQRLPAVKSLVSANRF